MTKIPDAACCQVMNGHRKAYENDENVGDAQVDKEIVCVGSERLVANIDDDDDQIANEADRADHEYEHGKDNCVRFHVSLDSLRSLSSFG